jgi:hypothetical protein
LTSWTVGETSTTITAYVNPSGVNNGTGIWLEPSGTYGITLPDGTIIPATFTYGSATVTFSQPIIYTNPSTLGFTDIQLLDSTVTNYRPHVSKVDGNLYYANGRFLGRILAENTNISFYPSISQSYTVNFGTTALLQSSDTITDMTDLKSTMIISGQKDLYGWDYVSATTTAPVPVGESIKRVENILNNIYILAGEKGSIYVSNGYSAQLLTKLPDYIAGVFDPVWVWGDMMVHRSKLFVQALAIPSNQ